MDEISEKQLEANQQNAQLGGVKTEAGKEISKYNAVKHNLLTNLLNEDEATQANYIKSRLQQQYDPANAVEEILVERIAIWYVRLQRAVTAEAEQLKSIKNPRKVEEIDLLKLTGMTETKVIQEGYLPKMGQEDVEKLATTYLRYETEIERNLYKAIRELTKAQEIRKGQS